MRTAKTPSANPECGILAHKRVESHLRKAIRAGRLRPRQRIIEEDLAHELNISRGPVREAILRLEGDGLVVNTPRHGTFIRDVSLAEIAVIFRMRAKLEGLCVRYMRENPYFRAGQMLAKQLKRLNEAPRENDEEFFLADIELHRTIWRAANQPVLYRTLNLLMNPCISLVARSTPLACRESHEHYVQMILKTPIDKVEEEVEQHFERMYSNKFALSISAAVNSNSEIHEVDLAGTQRDLSSPSMRNSAIGPVIS